MSYITRKQVGLKPLPQSGGTNVGSLDAGVAITPIDSGWTKIHVDAGPLAGQEGWCRTDDVITAPVPPPPPPPPPTTGNYPRLANLYSFGNGHANQLHTFQYYDLVVSGFGFSKPGGKISQLKALGSGTKVVAYIDTTAVPAINGFGGMTIKPEWWLKFPGTALALGVSASDTTIWVTNPSLLKNWMRYSLDLMVDGETMHIVSANSNQSFTVQRGHLSQATAHSQGAAAALHGTNWPGVWMLDLRIPEVVNYLASYVKSGMTAANGCLDGVFYDNANATISNFPGGVVTATDWGHGESALFSATSAALQGLLVMGNGPGAGGSAWPGETGQELEHFPFYLRDWATGLSIYLASPGSIVNVDTNNTGTIDYQVMRLGLGTALLGDGYYAYDGGGRGHGQTWWFDEYDGGQGSCLASPMSQNQNTVYLVAGTGQRFAVGDTVWVSNDQSSSDDEEMLVTAVNPDNLVVQRGANGSGTTSHRAGLKVLTAQQRAAGRGWLGQPTQGHQTVGPNQCTRAFTNGLVLVNGDTASHTFAVPSGYRKLAGTQDRQHNDGSPVGTSVTVGASDAVILVH